METRVKELIRHLYNTKEFQDLNAYYSKTTVFNVLGAERSENRHSSFLCWLLNNKASHGLGEEPMKKFLRLYFSNLTVQNKDILISHIMTGNYALEIEEITTEKVIGKILGNTDKSRFDLWALLTIKYVHEDKNESEPFVFVIENKIYSSENEDKVKKEYQTDKYNTAIDSFIVSEKKTKGIERFPLRIFLTPNKAKAHSPVFHSMSYQEVLDDVIEPLVSLEMPNESKTIITDFIRNLSKPSEEEEKGYSILATSKEERSSLESFYKDKDVKLLYDSALCLVGGDTIKGLFSNRIEAESQQVSLLMNNLWDANRELFKSVLFNVVMPSVKDDKDRKKLESVFKEKKDTTHYQINGNGDYNKCKLIHELIKTYINSLKAPITIDQLQTAFPSSLRGTKVNSLGNMFVIGEKRFNLEVANNKSQLWRWPELQVKQGMVTEDGKPTRLYATNQWGMSEKWPIIVKKLSDTVKVTITEIY